MNIEEFINNMEKRVLNANPKSTADVCNQVVKAYLDLRVEKTVVKVKDVSKSFKTIQVPSTDELHGLSLALNTVCSKIIALRGYNYFVTSFTMPSVTGNSTVLSAGVVDPKSEETKVKVEFKIIISDTDKVLNKVSSDTTLKFSWLQTIMTIRQKNPEVVGAKKADNTFYLKVSSKSALEKVSAYIATQCYMLRMNGEPVFMISKKSPGSLIIFILRLTKDFRVMPICKINIL